MKKAKLAPGMEDYSDAAFENKTQGIYTSMLNNLYFPNPTPALTEPGRSGKGLLRCFAGGTVKRQKRSGPEKPGAGNACYHGDTACQLGNDYRQWRQSQAGEHRYPYG